ncbi:DUF1642 domain-containing protein [Streptococcus suis]|nr:DUF1642 domain-containing protein [Streptococcus suis]
MNKQEAIEKVKEHGEFYSNMFGGTIKMVPVGPIIDIISQIHEPQKVVVPKHIADKIEYCKDTEGYGLFHAMDYCYNYKDSAEWLEDNQETFAKAWLFGYEVESEQLFTVRIPDPNRPDTVTFLYKENGKVFIGSDIFLDEVPNYKWEKEPENQLTESEIKQDFEWAWQFAVPVEEG